jgi:hypothetical protein
MGDQAGKKLRQLYQNVVFFDLHFIFLSRFSPVVTL